LALRVRLFTVFCKKSANDLDTTLGEHTGWRNMCICLVPLSLLRTEEDLV
jgi:hypothetical protein